MKIQKKIGGGGSFLVGCERKIEVFVKIQKENKIRGGGGRVGGIRANVIKN